MGQKEAISLFHYPHLHPHESKSDSQDRFLPQHCQGGTDVLPFMPEKQVYPDLAKATQQVTTLLVRCYRCVLDTSHLRPSV